MQLIPVKSPSEFRLSSLIPVRSELTRRQQAAIELIKCYDEVWEKLPVQAQDFLLRVMRCFGLPVNYQGLPFWLERAVRHLLTLCCPTLRDADFKNPTSEDFGRITGHMLAIIAHAKENAAVFEQMPRETSEVMRRFLYRIEEPVRVLADEGLRLPLHESEAFLKGMHHAFGRTFDAIGYPRGWNTNSPVQMGICFLWRFIVVKKPSLPVLHKELQKFLGEHIVGDEDRVKKICHRLGLRFSGDRSKDSKGTAVILDVPSETKILPDK